MKSFLGGALFFAAVVPSLSLGGVMVQCECYLSSQNADPQLACPENDAQRASTGTRDVATIGTSSSNSNIEINYPSGVTADCNGQSAPMPKTKLSPGKFLCDGLGDNCVYTATSDKSSQLNVNGCKSYGVNTVTLQKDASCTKQLSLAALETDRGAPGEGVKRAQTGSSASSGSGSSTAGSVNTQPQ